MWHLKNPLVLLCMVSAFVDASLAYGQPSSWNGAGSDTNFSTAANWIGTTVPSSGTTLQFIATNVVASGNFTVTLDQAYTLSAVGNSDIYINPTTAHGFTIASSGGNVFTVGSGTSSINTAGGTGLQATHFSAPISIPSGSTLEISVTNSDVFSGQISGLGSLSINNGPMSFTGASVCTYSGNTTLSGATVTFNNGSTFPHTGVFAVTSSGILTYPIQGTPIDQTFVINSNLPTGMNVYFYNNTIELNTSSPSNNLTVAGAFTYASSLPSSGSYTGGSFVYNGPGTVTLTGSNQYSYSAANLSIIGNTTVNAGTLIVGAPNGIGGSSNVTIAGGATLSYSAFPSTAAASIFYNSIQGTGSLVLPNQGASITGNQLTILHGQNKSFTGPLTGGNFQNWTLSYNGASSLTLGALSSTPFQIIQIETTNGSLYTAGYAAGSSLQINGDGSYFGLTASTTVPSVLVINSSGAGGFGGIDTNGHAVTWTGVIQGAAIFAHADTGAGSLTVNPSAGSNSISGFINKNGGLTFASTQAINLSAKNSYTYIIDAGIVDLSVFGSSLATLGYLSGEGGQLNVNQNFAIYYGDGPATVLPTQYKGTFSYSGGGTPSFTIVDGTLTTTNTSVFNSFAGQITLGEDNSPAGGATQSTLYCDNLGAVTQLNYSGTGGSVYFTKSSGSTTFTGPVVLSVPSNNQTVTAQIFVQEAATTVTLSGAVTSGSSSSYPVFFQSGGLGTLVLSSASNSFGQAPISVLGGTLQAGNANAFNGAKSVNVWPAATFDLGSVSSLSLTQLTGLANADGSSSGNVNLHSGVLSITQGESTYPFYGTISGTGGLTLVGAQISSTPTASPPPQYGPSFFGTNTYTGNTILQQGVYCNMQSLGSSSFEFSTTGAAGYLQGGTVFIGSNCSFSKDFIVDANIATAGVNTNTFDLTTTGHITVPITSAFYKTGQGTLTLSTANAGLVGDLYIQGGIFNATNTSLGSPNSITFNQFAGTFQANGAVTINPAGGVVLGTTGTFDTTSGNISIPGNVVFWDPPVGNLTGGGLYGGLSLTGGGILTLSGTNTYNGTTTIINGTLLTSQSAFPVKTQFPVGSGLTPYVKYLVFDADSGQTAIFKANSNFTAGVDGSFPNVVLLSDGTVNTNTYNVLFDNIVAGQSSFAFNKAGTGTLTLSGANLYKGATNVLAGTLKSGSSSVFVSSTQTSGAFGIGSNVTVSTGASLDLNGFNNTISQLNGSGTLTDSSGGTKGILTITDGGSFTGSITSAPSITFEGSASTNVLTLSGSSNVIGNLVNNDSGTLALTSPLSATSFSQAPTGILDLSNFAFAVEPSTNINCSSAVTFAGTITLPRAKPASNVYVFSYGSHSGTFTTANLPAGTTLNYTGTYLEWVVGGATGCNGTWNVNGNGSWTTNGNWSPGTCSPGIGNTGGLNDDQAILGNHVAAAITVTLNSTATLGYLQFGAASPTTSYTVSGSGSVVMGGSGALNPQIQVYGAGHSLAVGLSLEEPLQIISQTADAGLVISNAVSLGANNLTLSQSSTPTGTIAISGNMTGSGGIIVNGSVLTLNPSSDNSGFSGSLTLNSGVVNLNQHSIPSANAIVIGGNSTFSSLSALTFGNDIPLSTYTVTLDGSAGAFTLGGQISGSGGIETLGSVTLSGSNNYTGLTTVSTGTLTAGSNNAFGYFSDMTIDAGAVLDLAGFSLQIGGLVGPGSLHLNSGSLLINTQSVFDGNISGQGTLSTTVNVNELTLSGNNTNTGSIVVNKNVALSAGSTTAFGTAVISLDTNSHLNLSGFSNTVGGLSSSSTTSIVSLGSNTLTLNLGSSSASFSGAISGSGGAITLSSGSQTFAGQNTYSGATTVNGGTLIAGSSSTVGTGPFGNGSALVIGGSGSVNLNDQNVQVASLSGSGALSVGAGSLTIANGNGLTYSGAMTSSSHQGSVVLSKGTLTLSGNSSGYSGVLNIGSLTGPSTTVTAGSIHALGSGSVNVYGSLNIGSNAISLSDTTTGIYTQGSTGSLTLALGGSSGSITAAGNINLANALNLSGSPTGVVTILSGAKRSGKFSSVTSGYAVRYTSNSVQVNGGSTCTNTWTGGSGYWGDSSHWGGGCIPGVLPATDEKANFQNEYPIQSVIVSLVSGGSNVSPKLSDLQFGSVYTSYTIVGEANSGTPALQFTSQNFTNPQISVLSGSHTIDSAVVGFNGTETLDILIDGGATLTYGSSVFSDQMTSFGTVVISEASTASSVASFINKSIIDVGNIQVSGANTTNSGMMIADSNFSLASPAVLTNNATILANTFGMTGGTFTNTSLVSVVNLNISGGTFTNTDLVTAEPWNFSGGTVINSGTFTTTNFQKGLAAYLTVQLQSLTKYGYIDASAVSLDGPLTVQALGDLSFNQEQAITLISVGSPYSSKFSSVTYLNFPASVIPTIQYLSNAVELSFVPAAPFHPHSAITNMMFTSIGEHNMLLLRKSEQLKNKITSQNNSIEEGIATYFGNDSERLVAQSETMVLERKEERLAEKARKEGIQNPWSFYIGPIGTVGRIASHKSQPVTTYGSAGFLTGFDYGFDVGENIPFFAGLGAALDYRYKFATMHSDTGSFDVQKVHGTVYSVFVPKALPALDINLLLGYAYAWDDIYRNVGPSKSFTAKGDPTESLFDVVFDVEYEISHRNVSCISKHFSLIPFADLQYIHDSIGGYRETGAGIYNLKFENQTPQSLTTTLGSRFDYSNKIKSVVAKFELDLAWQREYLNQSRSVGYIAIDSTGLSSSAQVYGSSKNSALVSFDILLTICEKFVIEASVDTKWNKNLSNAFFYLGLGGDF